MNVVSFIVAAVIAAVAFGAASSGVGTVQPGYVGGGPGAPVSPASYVGGGPG